MRASTASRRPASSVLIETYCESIVALRALERAVREEGMTDLRKLAIVKAREVLKRTEALMHGGELFRARMTLRTRGVEVRQ